MTKLSGEITEKDFPDKGILWRGWDDDTLRIIQEKNRPVLLFVADTDPFVWPFLREIFKAMPANARLGNSSTTSTLPCSSRRMRFQ